MSAWSAFRVGLRQAARYWQVWLLLFAVNVATALALALLPAQALVSIAGQSLAAREAADGLDAWLVLEALSSPLNQATLQGAGAEPTWPPGLSRVLLSGLVSALALPLLAWLPSAFLNGGVLLTYAEATLGDNARTDPAPPRAATASRYPPFHWRRFLWGCGHWLGPFLLLGAVQGAGLALLLAGGLAAAAGAAGRGQGTLAVLAALAAAFLALVWLALNEAARAAAVAEGSRQVGRAFGRAGRLLLRRLPQAAGLYGLGLLLAAGLHGLFRLGLFPLLPLDCWPLVLLAQQAFVLARLGTRLARQAGLLALLA